MFTGLVQDLGTVAAVEAGAEGVRLAVRTGLAGEIAEGDSVAVNGVCLTATRIADGHFSADVMHETLRRSSLAGAREGTPVNLELPLRPSDRLKQTVMAFNWSATRAGEGGMRWYVETSINPVTGEVVENDAAHD